jgi:RNA polymerase sigma factor (TIGR02999 family)
VTLLLSDHNNPEALRAALALSYDDLHMIARTHFKHESVGHTLQPTALVNEACARLIDNRAVLRNRKHLFGAASEAMRRTLVESARRRYALKRGGPGLRRVDLSAAERLGFENLDDLLDFDAAVTRLESKNPLWSQVVKLRVFSRCSTREIAVVLEISKSAAKNRWDRARHWLKEDLSKRGYGAQSGRK